MTRRPSVSIVIPALNEADNIVPLVKRIDSALQGIAYYEIIFIDDHSTDKTVANIKAVARATKNLDRKLTAYSKIGLRGKAFSLIEGFEKARMEHICILDADLQYPPEAIPEMLEEIGAGCDVVVADRQVTNIGLMRKSLSKTGRMAYGKLLYGLSCDVQSGQKLFRSAVLDRMVLESTPWTFDLSFLVQAKEQGYVIGSVSIPFSERQFGNSKVNVVRVGFEIFSEALKFKFKKRTLIPVKS